MPIPVKDKCPKCGEETDIPNIPCISCTFKSYIKNVKYQKN